MAASLAMTWVPLCASHREVGEQSRRCAVRFSPENTSPDGTANFSIASVPQFGRHSGKPQLFSFGSFALVRPFFSGIDRCEKRLGARRSVHLTRERFTEGNILAVERNR